MYTHRVWRRVDYYSYKAICCDLFYNGNSIGCFTIYPGDCVKYYYYDKIYKFTTVHDMFTALRMLKDICK